MEISTHYNTDKYGFRYAIVFINETDDFVVFDSYPKLAFDFKEHGIKIKRSINYDYTLRYTLKDGRLYFCGFEARFSFWRKRAKLLGVPLTRDVHGRLSRFVFDKIPTDYSGTLTIGRRFDKSYWRDDEKAYPTPFSPEAYKENGYLTLENGVVVKTELK